jgi:hypothetical protein
VIVTPIAGETTSSIATINKILVIKTFLSFLPAEPHTLPRFGFLLLLKTIASLRPPKALDSDKSIFPGLSVAAGRNSRAKEVKRNSFNIRSSITPFLP